ncbi:MFS transporter, partial [Actinotalea sp. C106]|uniref:MFS transporter n=1 Tax=Actinotalea sp. C106 TaxID=2908644 RepID=UPI0020297F3D
MTGGTSQTALLAVLGVLYWSAHTMLRPLIGPYVLDDGGTATEASLALASFAVLPTLLAIPLGAMTDRWGVRTLLVSGGAVMTLGGGVLFVPAGLAGVMASQALIGVGTLAVWVSLQTVATLSRGEDEPPRVRNARLATFSLFLAAGQAIGPALGGLLADAGGYFLAFGAYTGLSALLILLALAVRSGPRAAAAAGSGATAGA